MKKQNLFLAAMAITFGLAANSLASPIQVTSITGASRSLVGDALNAPIIYGGIAGKACSGDNKRTCNNCVVNSVGGESACNTRRIYPSLKLKINFVVTGTVNPINGVYSHASLVATPVGSNQPVRVPGAKLTGRQLVTGSNDSITVAWSNICAILTGDSTCETNTGAATPYPENIYIAIDAMNPPTLASGTTQLIQVQIISPLADGSGAGGVNDNSIMNGCFMGTSASKAPAFGICNFIVGDSDQKVTIESLSPNVTCNPNYVGVRVYYQPDDGKHHFSDATYGTKLFADFKLDSDCNPVGDWSIKNLKNETGYFFRTSMLDVANNNAFLINADDMLTGNSITDQASCPNYTNYSYEGAAACAQYGLPSLRPVRPPNHTH